MRVNIFFFLIFFMILLFYIIKKNNFVVIFNFFSIRLFLSYDMSYEFYRLFLKWGLF